MAGCLPDVRRASRLIDYGDVITLIDRYARMPWKNIKRRSDRSRRLAERGGVRPRIVWPSDTCNLAVGRRIVATRGKSSVVGIQLDLENNLSAIGTSL